MFGTPSTERSRHTLTQGESAERVGAYSQERVFVSPFDIGACSGLSGWCVAEPLHCNTFRDEVRPFGSAPHGGEPVRRKQRRRHRSLADLAVK